MNGKDIEKASVDYQMSTRYRININPSFISGAEWVLNNLWKSANGNDLPEIDREVIVLYQPYPLENSEYAVSFAHRPKEYWDGKNIITGEITRYYPKRYDKGNWNIPDVKWWLDLDLPKMEE